jgi:hypothetical protein
VHHQLQSGPGFQDADALACHFDGIDPEILDRGS